eukprot:4100848-Amphidinium_carterae.1
MSLCVTESVMLLYVPCWVMHAEKFICARLLRSLPPRFPAEGNYDRKSVTEGMCPRPGVSISQERVYRSTKRRLLSSFRASENVGKTS